MKVFFNTLFATPWGVLAFASMIPMLISLAPSILLKNKRARRVFAAIFVLSAIVGYASGFQMDRQQRANEQATRQALQENPLVMQLAEDASKYLTRDTVLEGGSAAVREPWIILHVETRPDEKTHLDVTELTDVMYSWPEKPLTQEALSKARTICLWCTHMWESAQYVNKRYGGAILTGTSEKAYCWIYDVEDGSALLREEYTLYSKALGEHDGAVEYKVKPSQVRQSVLDRMAPSKETEKGD